MPNKETIRKDGIEYKIETDWNKAFDMLSVNLEFNVSDWKAFSGLVGVRTYHFEENEYQFGLKSNVFFGNETDAYGYTDYDQVNLIVTLDFNGKLLYEQRMDVTCSFHKKINFSIRPNFKLSDVRIAESDIVYASIDDEN